MGSSSSVEAKPVPAPTPTPPTTDPTPPTTAAESVETPAVEAPSESTKSPPDNNNDNENNKDDDKVYNVYAQQINPDNNMPYNLNQAPAPGQKDVLPTERVVSSIPKGGTDGTWTFPSPQMFYNALARKGKLGEMSEEHAAVVVAIHNNMNERTWRMVEAWEAKFHGDECPTPKLLKFMGKPHTLSPRAKIVKLLSGNIPFDRHDWVVDRCGTHVRYIIDYYYSEEKSAQDVAPALHDADAIKSISMVVRPALDSVSSLWDVTRMAIARATGDAPPAGTDTSAPNRNLHPKAGSTVDGLRAGVPTHAQGGTLTLESLAAITARLDLACGDSIAALRALHDQGNADPMELAKVTMATQMCVGKIVCNDAWADVQSLLAADDVDQEAVFARIDVLADCIDDFQAAADRLAQSSTSDS